MQLVIVIFFVVACRLKQPASEDARKQAARLLVAMVTTHSGLAGDAATDTPPSALSPRSKAREKKDKFKCDIKGKTEQEERFD